MVREEDWILQPHSQGLAIIKTRRFLGHEYRYSLQTPSGHQLFARTSVETVIPIGTNVNLSLASRTVQRFLK